MLVKFETKSQRVKGLSFHPNRPWILSSLHSGEIQLWDYRIGTLIDKFEEHEGPVRGISFHLNQPLFVSGGDDYKIVGWNYKTKKKIFILKGHLDYIRTVSFHHELPWVLSTSDDQTIRIWNYLSRTQLTILTGHSHYVMCAQFHPTKDLIVSCSLDQTLRLWDYSNLRRKYTSGAKAKPHEGGYTGNDVEVKAIMEGHERGVNWCSFHPTTNLIVSAADDRKVKLWKYNESTGKAWEHDSLYGHTNNVSCVVFHDKLDCIISNGEDKTIKVWDLNRRICIDTFRRDTDRYWILAMHPELNYIAAGSDSGLTVFTLQSERVPACLSTNQQDIFYVHKKQLIHRDIKSGRETVIKNIDHTPSNQSLQFQKPSTIYYNTFNPSSHNILVQYKDKERIYYKYFLFSFEHNIDKAKNNANSTFRYCITACFIGKDKIAVLNTSKELGILEPSGSIRNIPNLPPIDMIYPGPLGKIILRSENVAILYDLTTRKVINQLEFNEISRLKRVVWNHNYSYCALICKKTVYLVNKTFTLIGTIQEKFNVTSAFWNYDNVLIYTTVNHLKYSILNGDHGILKCIDAPYYLVYVKDNEALTIDKDAKIQSVLFDREEYLFKVALFNKDAKRIKFLMENHKKLGNAIIAYLYKKNYSAIALNMVTDTRARFSLALDSGNLEVAFKTCHEELKDKDCYQQLGEEALRQGNHQIVEVAYQKTRNLEKLSFLYLITGNLPRLEKMLLLAQSRGDVMHRFQIALYTGDVQERIRILAEVGLLHLAYLTAVAHNIPEMAEPLYESLKDNPPDLDQIDLSKAEALIPPKPLIINLASSPVATCNWPHHQLQEEDILLTRDTAQPEEVPETQTQEMEFAVDTEPITQETTTETSNKLNFQQEPDIAVEEGNWGFEDITDIPEVEVPATKTEAMNLNIADSAPGKDPIIEKAKNSQFAGELVAIGEFDAAISVLKKQIGLINPDPLLPIFNKIRNASNVKISGLPFINPTSLQLSLDGKRPYVMVTINQLGGMLKTAYRFTSEGKFQDAHDSFREILLHIPFLVLRDNKEESDIYALIKICYNYIFAMRCELAKKTCGNNPVRLLELSAYMVCCALQPAHRILALRSSMALAYKMNDFIYAAFFAKKIVTVAEANPNATKPEVVENAKKIYSVCEQKGQNEHKIEFEESWLYDDDAIQKICAKSLKLIKGKEIRKDALVKASYSAEFDGQVDDISGVCKIGAECLGLKLY